MSEPVYIWQLVPITMVVFGCGLIVGAKAPRDVATIVGSVILVAGAVLLVVLARIWT